MKDIGNKTVYPKTNTTYQNKEGLTYREYLIAQIAGGVDVIGDNGIYNKGCAESVIDFADAIIEKLNHGK